MPYETEPAEVFMVHRGVPVYHIYRHDMMSSGDVREYWYSFWAYASDDDPHGENGTFDIRELPGWKAVSRRDAEANKEAVIRGMIDAGYFDKWTMDDGTPVLANIDKLYQDEKLSGGLTARQRRFLCCVLGYWLDANMDELPPEVTGLVPGGPITRSEARDIVLQLGGDPENPRGE